MEAALSLLDEIDGTSIARKIDEAAFIEAYVKAPPRRGEGALGSTKVSVGGVLWLIQYFVIVLAIGAIGVVLVTMKFILVPLVSAYFVTFLLAPLLDFFGRRPHPCCGKGCARRCARYQRSSHRRKLERWRCSSDCTAATLAGMLCLLKLPHKLVVLATLLSVSGMLLGLYALPSTSLASFLSQKEAILHRLQRYVDGGLMALASNGITINAGVHGGNASASLLFGGTEASQQAEAGVALGQVLDELGSVAGVALDLGLVLVLAVLLLLNKGESGRMMLRFAGEGNRVAAEVEEMIKHYITLKTGISLGTGLIWCSLDVCSVQLAPIFGLLTFLLNFVPNVGSMIATLLPVPILLLDDQVSILKKRCFTLTSGDGLLKTTMISDRKTMIYIETLWYSTEH